MGTSRAGGRRAARRFPAAFCLAAAAVTGLTACEPADGAGALNTASVAFTTDRTATRALEHEGVRVRWLTCTASLDGGGATRSRTPSATRQEAEVHCDGKTTSGGDIALDGQVTYAVEGRCVRGDMTAKTGGRAVFRATLLGDCTAPATTAPPAGTPGRGNGPTATVTVTVTAYPGK
ncbi:hypothetical protein NEH16_21710 [Streptomyces drozdowiczii]|uniref:Lipoprotein n=1 Tax=Streptomyces drozdowiczii TaxID=202862 RepID=A0ABY6PVR7_9ACTN|nr:hypothetical protein [Streptomyces drozdowiczii]MCX0243769.1 hypothetical protein [Streptomyces drozdowiczii]UZK56358.1 hypothetical protein NEH16_21710 [Streptomyces drozdowiczii]